MVGFARDLEALKQLVSGYDRFGQGSDFASFYPLSQYDGKLAAWKIPRKDLPLTLLSKGQLDLVEELLVDIGNRGIPGDCIEAGVWRGGTIILMRAVLDSNGMADRQVIAADTFCGIPPSTRFRHDPVDGWSDRWIASLEEVKDNLADINMLDDRIELLEGLFADSLPSLTGRQLALIRLDCDSYDSVMDALEGLYPLLMPGGAVIIDDWHLIGCRLAVDAYRKHHAITDVIEVCAENGYWFKSQANDAPQNLEPQPSGSGPQSNYR